MGRVDVQICVFLTWAPVGGEWTASRSYRFTPRRKSLRTHWIGDWVDPRAGRFILKLMKVFRYIWYRLCQCRRLFGEFNWGSCRSNIASSLDAARNNITKFSKVIHCTKAANGQKYKLHYGLQILPEIFTGINRILWIIITEIRGKLHKNK
jgi:hypothetical protein